MTHIPRTGHDRKTLLRELDQLKSDDVDWKNGRSWSLVYYGGEEHTEFLKEVYGLYFSENAAGPSLFPSLRQMEAEVVSMVSALVAGNLKTCGTMTSGGTESILLAMKAYRDQARVNSTTIKKPEILVPVSAHPAFLKAAQYFDLTVIPVPLDDDFRCDVGSARELITPNTICLVASAPSFPQGVMDPIPALGAIATKYDIGLHVDACLGGLLLPFMKKLGIDVPPFGFDVPGVSSISTDLHKNGYAAKGASAILYNDAQLRRYQFFVSSNWPGGLQASPTMLGTRPGGAVAAAWAALMLLGEEGYMDIAKRTMDTTRDFIAGIRALKELRIIGEPIMSIVSFTSDSVDMYALGDRIDSMGWRINRQNDPPSLHVVVTPNHAPVVEEFLSDLEKALNAVLAQPRAAKTTSKPILYGGTADFDDEAAAKELMVSTIENYYRV